MDSNDFQTKMALGNKASDPWSGGHNQVTGSKLCYCRIYEVDAENRSCSIKTFGPDDAVANADYKGVQWLSLYSNPEGDEITYVPRPESLAICAFVGGHPYIVGYFSPIALDSNVVIDDQEGEGLDNPVGGSAAINKEKINPGDFLLRTIGRCRLVLRAGGEIEIEATKVCKRTYFPARNRITEICSNLETSTDGGFMNWTHIDQNVNSVETLYTLICKDDVSGTNVVTEERGTVDTASTIVHRYQVRPGGENTLDLSDITNSVIVRETYSDGTIDFKVNQTAFQELIQADGSYTRSIADRMHLTTILPTGEVHVNINKKYDRVTLPDGSTAVKIADKWALDIKPTGETVLDVGGKSKITILPSGDTTIDVGGKSRIVVKASGDVEIVATKVDINGGTVNVGKGASFSAVHGEPLKTWLEAHIHPTGVGPSGPPTVPLPAPALSSKVKVS